MRNWVLGLCLALVLTLAVAPLGVAETEQDKMQQLAEGAAPLIAVVSAQMLEDQDFFSGAPNDFVGWGSVANYINRYAETSEDRFSQDEVKNFYDGLFAEGDPMLVPVPDGLLLKKDGDGYAFDYAAGDPWEQTAINQVTAGDDGRIVVDFTTWVEYEIGGQALRMNGVAELVPDEKATFGAKIYSMNPPQDRGAQNDLSASATETLAPQSGISYAAKNVLDGDAKSCWAYDAEKTPDAELSIQLSEQSALRALMFNVGYAKSEDAYKNNRRAKKVEITLNDGAVITKDIPDMIDAGCDSCAVVLFEGVHLVDNVKIRVLDTYPGEKFNDMCISEVWLF